MLSCQDCELLLELTKGWRGRNGDLKEQIPPTRLPKVSPGPLGLKEGISLLYFFLKQIKASSCLLMPGASPGSLQQY